ncbi:hypothetical protein OG488_29555 [Streptomyces sp. NBC_01460]|uniref:hypothetical protein n=1 Tax=Streptomyces sp. NBC_01460 TaxID=2903875 RepID=UPI002E300520|nr:hypothetical protein [Streptomyces sp. NBC_01460]
MSRAQAAGDTTGELEALQKRVRQLEEDATSWEDMAQSCREERDKARGDAATAEALRQDRDYGKNEYLGLSKGGSGRAATSDAWSEIPLLGSDAVLTFEALAKASEEHIVLTARAARGWKDSRYPYPQEMADRLTALAQAAMDLYSIPARCPGWPSGSTTTTD